VLYWILRWWRFDVFSSVRLGDAGVERRPLATVVPGNSTDHFVFLDFLEFYL
jgi:hypothetical protein